ncbi:MAG TPA: hypothetical protein VKM72_21705 [Thermoanaerobaculia bacterium]|nr:hypothetical protein [Thermoanaerobaculia bacterium]
MASMKRGLMVLPALLFLTVAAQAQVGLAQFSSDTTGVSGYIAILDIGSGTFTPVVTALDTNCRSQGNGQVSLLNTGQFAINQNTILAITANSGPGGVTGCGTPAGLLVSNGKLVNPGQTDGPVLYFNSLSRPQSPAARCRPVCNGRSPARRTRTTTVRTSINRGRFSLRTASPASVRSRNRRSMQAAARSASTRPANTSSSWWWRGRTAAAS